jgi:hypothetical protein
MDKNSNKEIDETSKSRDYQNYDFSEIDKNGEEEQPSISMEVLKISNDIMSEINVTERYSEYFSQKYSGSSYRNFLYDLINYKYDFEILSNILNDIKIKQKIENLNLPKDIKSFKKISNYELSINNNEYPKEYDDLGNFIIDNNNHKLIENNITNNFCNDKTNENIYYKKTNSRNNSVSRKRNLSHENERSKNEKFGTYNNPNFENILRSYNTNQGKKKIKKENKKPFNRFGKLNGQFFEKNILKKNTSSLPKQNVAAYDKTNNNYCRKL